MITEREPFDSPELAPLDLFLWGWKKSETYVEKWIHQTNCSPAIWMLLSAQRNTKINSDEQHAIFAQQLQSTLGMAVGFANINCEL